MKKKISYLLLFATLLFTIAIPFSVLGQSFGSGTIPSGFSQTFLANPPALNRTPIADAPYTQKTSDTIIAFTSLSATRALTLITTGMKTGQIVIVKDESGLAGTNNITTAGVTIDGANPAINANFGSLRLYFNGATYSTW